MYDDQKIVTIHTTGGPVEEGEICAALDDAGINYDVQPFEDDALSGLLTTTMGYSRISVLEKDAEKAREVIQPILEEFSEPEEEQPEETT